MRKCVVTGVAGFIGSNLAEHLLSLGDEVAGIDNFSTGKEKNIERLRASLKPREQERFTLVRGDICDAALCNKACDGATVVFHHAALVSVPLSAVSATVPVPVPAAARAPPNDGSAGKLNCGMLIELSASMTGMLSVGAAGSSTDVSIDGLSGMPDVSMGAGLSGMFSCVTDGRHVGGENFTSVSIVGYAGSAGSSTSS